MTVKELKERLSTMPDNAEVVITVEWTSGVEKAEYHEADTHIKNPYVELS